MFTLHVNGQTYEVEKDEKLITFLRETLGLTSVKDGCDQGACGACTVLVDGKTVKPCVQKISRFEGKEIVTVEGLSQREKEVYVYAFGEAGAVQCGFCIPGMVLCGKGLIDQNPNPTRKEIAFAIRNNICRCTGYKKIIDAIELAARLLREGRTDLKAPTVTGVGQRAHRVDVAEKVLGYGKYTNDIQIEGMLVGSALRAQYPRARVLSIDTSAAKAVPGVHAVLTADDIPGSFKVGHLKQDWDALVPVGHITHYLGDAVALVAAETWEQVQQAKALIKVEYEVLDPIFDAHAALEPGAPLVHESSASNVLAHEHLVRGNADEVLAKSAHVVTRKYYTPPTEHAFLEPECAVAMVDDENQEALIYTSDQGTYDTQHECSLMMGWAPEKIHVVNALVGGGFGGKEDVTVQHHALLLAYHTHAPVKVKLTRDESILIHPKRHAAWMEFTTGCDENGYLTAMKAVVVTDTGAYASLGGPVLQRLCTHAAGPYNYQVIDIDGTAVYTNNPPAGAFRGFGVTQSCFATECNLNLLAEEVGISPWEIRYRNAIRPGQVLPNGQIAFHGTALAQTLEAVKEVYENHPRAGIACAMKNAGVGVGLPDWGRCRITIEDGKVWLRAGASCIGQGLGTVLTQVACETLGVTGDVIRYPQAETNIAPDAGTTSGSRQTLVTGEACRRACVELKKELDAGKTLEELNGREFYGEYLAKTDKMGADKPNPVSHVGYGYATQVVCLNEDGTIEKVVAAHDVGRAINPLSVEGQIEGGVVMSLGFALTEDFPMADGKPTAKFGTLGLFRADKTPPVEAIIVEANPDPLGYGAVGIGEITSIPTAPAVQGAYYKFDGNFRTSLPLENTPYARKKK
ncbi:selenium-dependent xanthine dehydrogenase [Pseudoflavonifractor phocaeensis]|uniref:selenium-dependent xanthine dehydrogenase n=1 Tax=Pseudoflavonifractor phocaeensis TaxID=1870988 RepID=UPI00195E1341|nr:selenium-dependent xanthine dehydrogenase [Pseudoflavonifractor phocaeensis]MBM6938635.1 selenium-dependent xanthine dehydrogenase [Pseudoflavonifractor phocaeensis]